MGDLGNRAVRYPELQSMNCVTMRYVNEGLIANMIADGEDLKRIYETLAILSKKIDVIHDMMKVEQDQRLAAMKAQQPSGSDQGL